LVKGWLRLHLELSFMHDNASPHASKITREELAKRNIRPIEWPAFSPDLNPIKHAWKWMKDYIADRFKDKLSDYQLIDAIQEAWEAVPISFLDGLIQSMPARVQWVLNNQGGHLKY
jgi:transposase